MASILKFLANLIEYYLRLKSYFIFAAFGIFPLMIGGYQLYAKLNSSIDPVEINLVDYEGEAGMTKALPDRHIRIKKHWRIYPGSGINFKRKKGENVRIRHTDVLQT